MTLLDIGNHRVCEFWLLMDFPNLAEILLFENSARFVVFKNEELLFSPSEFEGALLNNLNELKGFGTFRMCSGCF
jgi:hypothetical protein